MALDVLALPELPDGEPAGPNLEFDAQFGELDRAAKGKEEVQYGSTIEAAVPPDWKEVEALALSLLARTRDLRIMTHLAIARLHLPGGVPAFAEVLTGIRTLLEAQWEKVHPQLDPEDELDPTLRANELSQLRDPTRVLRTLRALPLAGTVRKGLVTWRDIATFNGALEPEPGKEKKTEADIRGAFADTDPARRRALREGVERAIAEAAAIPAAFEGHAGIGNGPNLSDLGKLLREILKEVVRYSPPDAPDAAEGPAEGPGAEGAGVPEPVAAAAPASTPARGFASVKAITAVHRRDEVLHLLDLVLAYYREHEPSSPLPLLVERARRLAPLGFMDVLRDLAPDGVSQAQVVAGPDASASASE